MTPTQSRNSGKEFTSEAWRDAAILLGMAINHMAEKASVTPQEIVAAIEADKSGPVMRYLAGLLAAGVVAFIEHDRKAAT